MNSTTTHNVLAHFENNAIVDDLKAGPVKRHSAGAVVQLNAGKIGLTIGLEYNLDDQSIRMIAGLPPSKELIKQALHLLMLRSSTNINWRGEAIKILGEDKLAVELYRPIAVGEDAYVEFDQCVTRFVAAASWFAAQITACNMIDLGLEGPMVSEHVATAFAEYGDVWDEYGFPRHDKIQELFDNE